TPTLLFFFLHAQLVQSEEKYNEDHQASDLRNREWKHNDICHIADSKNGKHDTHNTFSCDQAGGKENSPVCTFFFLCVSSFYFIYDVADDTTCHDSGAQAEWQIHTYGKRHYRDLQDLNCYGDKYTDENQSPRKICIHNTFNQDLHHSCLCGRNLFCAVSPRFIQQVKHAADGSCRYNDTDQLTDLL